ncbi:MAG: glycosyltransferase family 39 protein, partial [Microbacteriaceae bacterium]
MTATASATAASIESTPAPVRSAHGDSPYRPWLARHWALWALAGIVLVSAVLYTWNINTGGFSDYYATAAKSMSESWRAFFFGGFDPQSTITLDKLSGFLIPQALSARLFGFSVWSLAVPQVLEGMVTVVATYYIVSRWIGSAGGLLAATIMAFTPLMVSMFAHPMEDG